MSINHLAAFSAALLLTVLASSMPALAGPFQNGNFASPTIPAGSFAPLNVSFTGSPPVSTVTLPGWQSTTSSTQNTNTQNFLVAAPYDVLPANQSQAVLFNGDGGVTTTLFQTFDTNVGFNYQVSFYLQTQHLSGNSQLGSGATIQLTASGNPQQSFAAPTVPDQNGVFTPIMYQYDFLAGASSTTLTFSQSDGSTASPELADVQVQAVPEPAGFGLLLCACAAALSRRSRPRPQFNGHR